MDGVEGQIVNLGGRKGGTPFETPNISTHRIGSVLNNNLSELMELVAWGDKGR